MWDQFLILKDRSLHEVILSNELVYHVNNRVVWTVGQSAITRLQQKRHSVVTYYSDRLALIWHAKHVHNQFAVASS